MYEQAPFNVQGPSVTPGHYDAGIEAIAEASARYQSLRFRSAVRRVLASLTGSRRRLLDLRDARAAGRLVASYDAGVRAVALADIAGSEDRAADFDDEFCPLRSETRQRWISVYAARTLGITMPAVTLIEAGGRYYVRDGHHRISVARCLGEHFVDAAVTEWEIAPDAAPAPCCVPPYDAQPAAV